MTDDPLPQELRDLADKIEDDELTITESSVSMPPSNGEGELRITYMNTDDFERMYRVGDSGHDSMRNDG